VPYSKARLANLECAILDTPVSLARRTTTGISVAVIHSRKCVPERDPLAPVNSEPMRLTDQALGLQLDTSIKKKTPLSWLLLRLVFLDELVAAHSDRWCRRVSEWPVIGCNPRIRGSTICNSTSIPSNFGEDRHRLQPAPSHFFHPACRNCVY